MNNKLLVSRRHFWGTPVQSVGVASLHLETILPVLLWMELSCIFLGVDVKYHFSGKIE